MPIKMGDDDLELARQDGHYDGYERAWTERAYQFVDDMMDLDRDLQKQIKAILNRPLDGSVRRKRR